MNARERSEELDYPDESVWTLSPVHKDEEKEEETDEDMGEQTDDHELSEAAEKVLSDLAEKFGNRVGK